MYLCRPKSTADARLLIQDSEIQSSIVKVLEAHQDRATKKTSIGSTLGSFIQNVIQNVPGYAQNVCLGFQPHHRGKKEYFAHVVANNSRLVFLGGRFGVADFLYPFGNEYNECAGRQRR